MKRPGSTKSPNSTRTNEWSAAPETTNADKLRANPDDQNALRGYSNEMERSIKFLADQDAAAPAPKKARQKMKSLLDSLVALARTLLAELEAKLDANPHDQ